ncbi:hypothetical protein EDC39_103209 [Geothermobacter ehrlichii]|uniref:MAE-28990/MAE-18760-like HEPN domain-containing protein n=1 Tax=Geothermobacter ehrlichii TaxID=213224 RepID=A0A5D3WMD6_9BACT|nr:hypothetical protein [Geothermobacter ehrlichii]TYO99363.1 hypothetical protein EDC39_103209 [Geothermobacter ehrlichii]
MSKLVNEFEDIGIFFELENLRLHCGFTKDILEKEQSDFKKRVDTKVESLTGSARENYLEWLTDNHFYLFNVFPSLQWLSLFNTAYSMFEKNMNYICRLAEIKTKSNFKLKDLNGQGIRRAKLYLKKVANIEKPFVGLEWKEITEYAALRNVMAHATGELDLSRDDHKKVLDFARQRSNIEIIYHNGNSEFPEIRLGPDIVFESIQNYIDFLRLLSRQDL